MGRKPPAKHDEFHQAFSILVQQRSQISYDLSNPQESIRIFDQLTQFQRQQFWQELNDNMSLSGDWTVKHFCNCYRKFAYTGVMQDHLEEADQLVAEYCNNTEKIDQGELKKIVRAKLQNFDIFPISIDNHVYHAVKRYKEGKLVLAKPVIKVDEEVKLNFNFADEIDEIVLKSLGCIFSAPVQELNSVQQFDIGSLFDNYDQFW